MKGAVKVFCLLMIGCNLIVFITGLQIKSLIIQRTNSCLKQACVEAMKDWQLSDLSTRELLEKVNDYFKPRYRKASYRFILTGFLNEPKMMKIRLEMNYQNRIYKFEEVLIEEVTKNEE